MKVVITLEELMTIPKYRGQICKTFKFSNTVNYLNMENYKNMVKSNNSNVVRFFYISLRYDDHDYHYIIDNCILDCGSWYNIMPKFVAYSLILKCTSDHPPIIIMYSKLIQPIGEIEGISIYLYQFINKYLIIYVVVFYVEPYFSILLSRHFDSQLEE